PLLMSARFSADLSPSQPIASSDSPGKFPPGSPTVIVINRGLLVTLNFCVSRLIPKTSPMTPIPAPSNSPSVFMALLPPRFDQYQREVISGQGYCGHLEVRIFPLNPKRKT